MTWIKVEDSLPQSGRYVLTVKKYLHDSGWGDPFAIVDRGWTTYTDNFRWEKGGKTTHWMEMPELPKDA